MCNRCYSPFAFSKRVSLNSYKCRFSLWSPSLKAILDTREKSRVIAKTIPCTKTSTSSLASESVKTQMARTAAIENPWHSTKKRGKKGPPFLYLWLAIFEVNEWYTEHGFSVHDWTPVGIPGTLQAPLALCCRIILIGKMLSHPRITAGVMQGALYTTLKPHVIGCNNDIQKF